MTQNITFETRYLNLDCPFHPSRTASRWGMVRGLQVKPLPKSGRSRKKQADAANKAIGWDPNIGTF